ncbi:hypothetical protein RD792_008704 [Penstemon davidsonii]|uniref:Uncharacterized protein n=1 Tax=Penstemon davidsonii TaxID=160366 RepID=A0ABR0DB19_9LAMI|nr:hypothetical protein RD792_008704 [Penstemon davidsonii]
MMMMMMIIDASLNNSALFDVLLQEFGLPSQVAKFTKRVTPLPVTKKNRFLHKIDSPAPQHDSKKWIGPAVKISLPSFSGCTEDNPNLLKVTPAKVTSENDFADGDSDNYKRNLSISVMLSKPILALEFNCLEMKVEAPTLVP